MIALVVEEWGQHLWGRCKVMSFDRFGEEGTPWHFWEDKSKLTGVPKKSLCQKACKYAVIALVLTPFVPFQCPLLLQNANINKAK